MRRTTGRKSLKRVEGDGYLAPIQMDPNRPITAGVPLRRCSNDTSISQRHNVIWPSTPSTLSQISTIRDSRESDDKESSSRLSSGYSPPFSTPSTKYVVPTNTAIESPATRSRSSVVTTKSTAEVRNASGRTRSVRLVHEKSRFPTIKAYRATKSLHTSSTSTKNDEFPLDDYIKTNDKRRLQDSGLLTYRSYSHSGSSTPSTGRLENESSHVDEISLSTESSLNFPARNGKTPLTRSAEWSLKSQVATTPRKISSAGKAKLNGFAGPKIEINSSENMHTGDETSTASSQAGEGDGDTIKTAGSEQASDQDYCFVPFIPLPGPSNLHHTPPQTSASAANKTGFSLKFRKPKLHQRPRSIVTNSSSSKGSSLPTTASTPNPMSPGKPATPNPLPHATTKEPRKNTMLLDDNNNNNNGSTINTKNKSMKSGLSLRKSVFKDGKIAAVVLPAGITYESAAIVAEEPSSSVAPAIDVYDPDESFWQSDSSSSEEKPPKGVVDGAAADAAKPKPHPHHHPHHGHSDGHHPHHAGKEHPGNAHHHEHHDKFGEGHHHEGLHPEHHHEGLHPEHHHEGFHPEHHHEGFHPEHHLEGFHPEHHPEGLHPEHHHEGLHAEHHHESLHPEHHHEGLHPEHYHEGLHPEHHHEGHHEEHHHEGHHEKEHHEGNGVDQEPLHPEGEKVETPPPKEEAGSENNKTEKTDPVSIKTVSVPVSAPKRLSAPKSSSIKTSSSSGYGYPSYDASSSSGYVTGTQTTTTSSPTEPDGPFLRTEKGAIRFHLPGRIQHKTTIKVAHFPTGDDKNIVLNVKKDNSEGEACCEEMMPPNCANNQNFVVPPTYASYPPQSYNPYNMYGYGDVSPYTLADYYRYYGYPTPPYC